MKINITVEFMLVVEIVMSSYLHLIQAQQSQSFGRQGLIPQRANSLRSRKVSNTQIIFREDEYEPLLPLPTFPTSTYKTPIPPPRQSVIQKRPPKPPGEKTTSTAGEIRVESVTQRSHKRPVNSGPVPVTKSTTVWVKTTAKPRSSSDRKRNPNEKVEEPVQSGSYYVPFRKMGQ